MSDVARELIERLGLQPHPMEGGFFRETYRSAHELPAAALPSGYPSARSISTAIYYLLSSCCFSEMHRLRTDEIFHFYLGSPVEMLLLAPDGNGRIVTLGSDVLRGQEVQAVVPAGVWQGSRLLPGGEYALLGCTVAPGFDYADYERGRRDVLCGQFPAFSDLIRALTRE
jgi:hypothetical protein